MTAISERDQLAYVAARAADARVNVELETEGMTLNIGPQHPATHGTLRIVAKLDGEQIISAEPVPKFIPSSGSVPAARHQSMKSLVPNWFVSREFQARSSTVGRCAFGPTPSSQL